MNRFKFLLFCFLSLFGQFKFVKGEAKLPSIKSEKKTGTNSANPPANQTTKDKLSEDKKKYLELLKKYWLIPTDEKDYERLSNRFKGASLLESENKPWVIPAISLMTPTGYVARWGDVYGSFSVNNRTRFGHIADGYGMVGMGFGNPVKWLGIELTLGFLNVKRLLNSGKGLSFKIGHTFPDGTSIAIGKIDFLQFPKNSADTGSSEYLALSKAFYLTADASQPFSLLIVSLGIGDGQFKSDEKFTNDRPGVGLFGSVGLRVIQPVTAIANWNHNLHLGTSIAPFRSFPLVVTLGFLDILKTQGDGVRYVVGISYSGSLFSDTFSMAGMSNSRL